MGVRVVIVVEVRELRPVGFLDGTLGGVEMIEMRVYELGVIVIRSGVDMLERRQKECHEQGDAGLQCGNPTHERSVYMSRLSHSILSTTRQAGTIQIALADVVENRAI
jgi:hypothetical protein